jgi:hypothetical protein
MRDSAATQLAKLTFPTRLVWFAFLSAKWIYAVALWLVSTSPERPFGDRGPLASDPLLLVLTAAALVAVFAGRLLPRRILLSDGRLRVAMAQDAATAFRGNPRMPPDDVAAIAALPAIEQRPLKLVPAWSAALIVEWSAYDVVAVLGLVLGFLRYEPMTFAPFGAAAFLLTLLARPRVDELHELARRSG